MVPSFLDILKILYFKQSKVNKLASVCVGNIDLPLVLRLQTLFVEFYSNKTKHLS